MMTMVRLKNGAEEVMPLVVALRMILRHMLEGDYGFNGVVSVYELAKLAKDRNHKIFSKSQFNLLTKLNLLEGTFEAPSTRDSTRNIVACMVEFRGEEPYLVDPRAA